MCPDAPPDPSNIFAIDDIKFLTGYNVEVVVASEQAIEGAVEKYYTSNVTFDDVMLDFDEDDVTEAFDKLLGDIDKEWRRAKAFHAMVRVRVELDDDGGASSVRVVKSRDADDFEGAVARIVEDLRVSGARGGSLEWTLAFKR